MNRRDNSAHFFPFAALVALVLLLSLPTIRYGYLLEDYKYLRSYSGREVIKTFLSHWEPTRTETKGYRPLHSVQYALFYLLLGGNPIRNHLLQIILLVTIVLLLYALIFRFTGGRSLAFWAAFIYPCLSTTAWQVSWLVNRQHLLLVIFFLSTLICYDRYLLSGSRVSAVFSFVFFLLALLLKEAMVTIPFITLGYALIIRKKNLRSQIKPLLPFFLILVPFLIIRARIVGDFPKEHAHPPPLPRSAGALIRKYSLAGVGTLVQSQGIRDRTHDFPIYDDGPGNPQDYIGLIAAAGLFVIGGALLFRRGSSRQKRAFLFGLTVFLIANALVAAWYRTNRLFISSVGVALMVGVLAAESFKCFFPGNDIRRKAAGLITLAFFAVYIAVNLSAFLEIQRALRPDGFLSLTWDLWVREEYQHWVEHDDLYLLKEEQLLLFKEKLRRTGRGDWADTIPHPPDND